MIKLKIGFIISSHWLRHICIHLHIQRDIASVLTSYINQKAILLSSRLYKNPSLHYFKNPYFLHIYSYCDHQWLSSSSEEEYGKFHYLNYSERLWETMSLNIENLKIPAILKDSKAWFISGQQCSVHLNSLLQQVKSL